VTRRFSLVEKRLFHVRPQLWLQFRAKLGALQRLSHRGSGVLPGQRADVHVTLRKADVGVPKDLSGRCALNRAYKTLWPKVTKGLSGKAALTDMREKNTAGTPRPKSSPSTASPRSRSSGCPAASTVRRRRGVRPGRPGAEGTRLPPIGS
jgi:hypothetical protein